jgi:hypothetical protein
MILFQSRMTGSAPGQEVSLQRLALETFQRPNRVKREYLFKLLV